MPAGDRKGPAGMGPVTGRGMGFCPDNRAAGANPGGISSAFNDRRGRGGMGGGFGRGRGRCSAGFRRGGFAFAGAGFSAGPEGREALEARLERLRQQAAALEEQLQGMGRDEQV